MTKGIKTVPHHHIASAGKEGSILTQLRLGSACTQNMFFCQKLGFLSIHIFLSVQRFLYFLSYQDQIIKSKYHHWLH
jgi:hypothetical protein